MYNIYRHAPDNLLSTVVRWDVKELNEAQRVCIEESGVFADIYVILEQVEGGENPIERYAGGQRIADRDELPDNND